MVSTLIDAHKRHEKLQISTQNVRLLKVQHTSLQRWVFSFLSPNGRVHVANVRKECDAETSEVNSLLEVIPLNAATFCLAKN